LAESLRLLLPDLRRCDRLLLVCTAGLVASALREGAAGASPTS
jgi:hypothetical protein